MNTTKTSTTTTTELRIRKDKLMNTQWHTVTHVPLADGQVRLRI